MAVQKKGCENQPWVVSFSLRAGGSSDASPHLFHGSNSDQDSKHLCEGPRGVPAYWLCIGSKQQLCFLSPGLPWTSLVLSLPSRLSVWLQSCGSRHCWDSDHAPRGLRKGSDEPGCPVVISAHSVISMCVPLKHSLICALKHCNTCRKLFSFPWKSSHFLFP